MQCMKCGATNETVNFNNDSIECADCAGAVFCCVCGTYTTDYCMNDDGNCYCDNCW